MLEVKQFDFFLLDHLVDFVSLLPVLHIEASLNHEVEKIEAATNDSVYGQVPWRVGYTVIRLRPVKQ